MKFLVTLVWIALAAMSGAAPKFAVIRVTDIYRDLPSTAAMQKDVVAQRNAIMENKRAEQFRLFVAELQSLQAELQQKRDTIDSEEGMKLVRSYEIKRQEAETLREEFERYRAEEEKRINTEMVSEMRASLERITAAAIQLAEERNLDGVLDTSGNSNTGVPFVLYSGGAEDITEDVVALLAEKSSETEPEAAPAETAEGEESP